MAKNPLINEISENYKILNFLGQGTYGYVVKCLKQDTGEIVAVKALKERNSKHSDISEVTTLDKLRLLDPDKNNIIRCLEWFHRCDRTFMVFEKLDVSLFDYMCQQEWVPLPLSGIRIVIRDVATALTALKDLGLIHTDLKLDNILLVHHQMLPFRVKLIDFGLTLETFEAKPLSNIQPLWYRSPEIILGLPFNQAIDVWSLGAVMSMMLLGFSLFQGRHEYDLLRLIVDLLGEPPRRLLNGGLNTPLFCHGRRKYRMLMHWRVMTTTEFHAGTGIRPQERKEYPCSSLEALKTICQHQEDSADAADRNACVELLKEMLQVDPKCRITPNSILAHPFITRGDFGTGNSCPPQAVQGHTTNPPKAVGGREIADVSNPKRKKKKKAIRGFFSSLKTCCVCI
ncbi:homeodomain-interacting protein kinase 3-like [Clinocottus analis]|uniref:homeodomain-interacting protein kinase 3-like n=1 Tax=Clinocottus analis TaxID=304258 RepID=UPI0035C13F93